MIGPVVKIDPATLPRRPTSTGSARKTYQELPAYLAHWDLGIMPFALNEATRFISPTKTPEFLAAGLPVVSIGHRRCRPPLWRAPASSRSPRTADEFVTCAEKLLTRRAGRLAARSRRASRRHVLGPDLGGDAGQHAQRCIEAGGDPSRNRPAFAAEAERMPALIG